MSRSGVSLEVIDGGREALEKAYLQAILFDLPGKQALARRLEPSANDAVEVVSPDLLGAKAPRRSGEQPA